MSLLTASPAGEEIVCSVSSCSYSFRFLFAAKLRKRNEKALGKGGKVGSEGKSLNKCSEFWAILFIRAGGCDVYRLVGRLRCAGS